MRQNNGSGFLHVKMGRLFWIGGMIFREKGILGQYLPG
jgi:hypothetical protein